MLNQAKENYQVANREFRAEAGHSSSYARKLRGHHVMSKQTIVTASASSPITIKI